MARLNESQYNRQKNLLCQKGVVPSGLGRWLTWSSPFLSAHESFHRLVDSSAATELQQSFAKNQREAALSIGRYLIEAELTTIDLADQDLAGINKRELLLRDENAGRTYLASSMQDGRWVSIRVLPSSYRSELGPLGKWIDQTNQLKIPGIQGARAAGVDRGRVFLVSEYVAGEDLGAWVQRTGPLPARNWIDVFKQVSGLLAEAELQKSFHREIRPSKILVDNQGQVVLRDWAFSNLLAAKKQKLANPSTLLKALPAHQLPFVAPEVFQNARHSPTRSAIYSLGCVAWFAGTGKLPRSAAALISVGAGLGTLETNFRLGHVGFPSEIDQVLAKMLAPGPAERFSSFAQVKNAIFGLEATLDASGPSSSDWSGVSMRAPVHHRRKRVGRVHWPRLVLLQIAGIASLVAGAGLLVYALGTRGVDQPSIESPPPTPIETDIEPEYEFRETEAIDSFQLE